MRISPLSSAFSGLTQYFYTPLNIGCEISLELQQGNVAPLLKSVALFKAEIKKSQ